MRQAQGRHHEAIGWCEQAIELARAAGDLDALAHAEFLLDWAYISLGRLDLATNGVEALALYEQLGNLGGQAAVANNLGQLAYYGGRWDEALELLERARELRLRTGDVVEAALASANCAEILLERGHYDEAEPLLRDARRVYQAVGYRGGLALTTAFLGRVAARTGRADEAYALLDSARSDFVAIEGGFEVRQVDTFIAEAMVLGGDAPARSRWSSARSPRARRVERSACSDRRSTGASGTRGPSSASTRPAPRLSTRASPSDGTRPRTTRWA